jgi:hypothetical protein
MDMQLYLRILWRFKPLVAAGLLLAIPLAVLSFAKVSFAGGSPSLKYRQAQTWQSEAVLFVTQRGFPWGTTTPQYQPANATEGLPAVPTADANRLSSLPAFESGGALCAARDNTPGAALDAASPGQADRRFGNDDSGASLLEPGDPAAHQRQGFRHVPAEGRRAGS